MQVTSMSYKRNSSRPLGQLPTPTIADGIIVSTMAVPPQKPPSGSLKKPEIKVAEKDSFSKPSIVGDGLEKQLKSKERQIKEKDKEIRDHLATIKSVNRQLSKSQV